MKKHLLLTCLAYMFFGVGLTVVQIGMKAGMSFELTIGIFTASLIFYLVVIFTSMEKVKKVLFKKDDSAPVIPTPEGSAEPNY